MCLHLLVSIIPNEWMAGSNALQCRVLGFWVIEASLVDIYLFVYLFVCVLNYSSSYFGMFTPSVCQRCEMCEIVFLIFICLKGNCHYTSYLVHGFGLLSVIQEVQTYP